MLNDIQIRELLYADDDDAFITNFVAQLQGMHSFSSAFEEFGLKISPGKTVVFNHIFNAITQYPQCNVVNTPQYGVAARIFAMA